MKREIKFRGKTNGELVYGSLCTKYENEPGAVYIIDDDCCYHKVEPESVGQFIGLTDKNSREIYEGDTVRWENVNVTGVIEWEKQAGAFWLKWKIYNENRYKDMHANFSDGDEYRIDYFEVLVDGKPDLFTAGGQEKINS